MNGSTLLLRQTVPEWIVDGRLSSQAFRPFSDDFLSTYDGDMISPKYSYVHYVDTLKNRSAGVYGATLNEVTAQNLGIIEDRKPYKEHISIDFSGINGNRRKTISRNLATCADQRGCLFKP